MNPLTLENRHPDEIRVGDHIKHAGATVTVTAIRRNELRRNWCFDIRDDTGSRNYVFYFDDGQRWNIVQRYE